MNKFKAGPSEGVFDSSAVNDLFEAFEKADAHVNRSDSADVPETDREDLARRIISEARTGETQPDLHLAFRSGQDADRAEDTEMKIRRDIQKLCGWRTWTRTSRTSP